MDIHRMERNKKLAERRERGEAQVSDDEDDELSPYVVVVPSGEESQSDRGPIAGADSTNNQPATNLLFDEIVAEKNSFLAHDNSIPIPIFSLAKNGISPPLTLSLAASLVRIRSINVKTVKHGAGETTKVTILDISNFPSEKALEHAPWCTCCNTFMVFLEFSCGKRIYEGFARHYNHMLSDPLKYGARSLNLKQESRAASGGGCECAERLLEGRPVLADTSLRF
jgi:hypothetical protein